MSASMRELWLAMRLAIRAVAIAGCAVAAALGWTAVPARAAIAGGAGLNYYEVREPRGTVRGTVMLIHGGGWIDTGTTWVRSIRLQRYVNTLVSWRWRVVNVSHFESTGLTQARAGRSIGDVDPSPMTDSLDAFYDQIRSAWPRQPLCIMGESAGGHLALATAMSAARRGVAPADCVVDFAGPTDLVSFEKQAGPAPPGASSCADRNAAAVARCLIKGVVFPTSGRVLRDLSPALSWPRDTPTKVWAVYTPGDPMIPYAQAEELPPAIGSNLTRVSLRDDSHGVPFVHSIVDSGDLESMWAGLRTWMGAIGPAVIPRRKVPRDGTVRSCQAGLRGHVRGPTLLRAGLDWTQSQSADGNIVPAASCAPTTATVATGLTLRAPANDDEDSLPTAAYGQYGELLYTAPAGRVVASLGSRIRAYRRSKDWTIGLFASSQRARRGRLVAGCTPRACVGVARTRVTPGGGTLLAAPQAHGYPDASNVPATLRVNLPDGTVRLSFVLMCANPAGCSMRASAPRPRDKDASPATLAAYDPVMRLAAAARSRQ